MMGTHAAVALTRRCRNDPLDERPSRRDRRPEGRDHGPLDVVGLAALGAADEELLI